MNKVGISSKYMKTIKSLLIIVGYFLIIVLIDSELVVSSSCPGETNQCTGNLKSSTSCKKNSKGNCTGDGWEYVWGPGSCDSSCKIPDKNVTFYGCYNNSSGGCDLKASTYTKGSVGCCGSSVGIIPSCTDTCGTADDLGSPWIKGDAPEGYIPACLQTTTKSGIKEDCGTCTDTKKWYLPNTPADCAPPASEEMYLCVSEHSSIKWPECVKLSTDSANPTRILLPQAGTPVYIKVKPVGLNDYTCSDKSSSNARGMAYVIFVNNLTSNPVWDLTCALDNKDYCQTFSGDIFSSDISGVVGLAQGSSYHVISSTAAWNRCTNDVQYSSGNPKVSKRQIEGYFKIDNEPTVVSVTPNSGLSGTWAEDTDADISCSDNNPQQFTAVYRDLDGCDDITAAGIWFSQSAFSFNKVQESVSSRVTKGSEVRIIARSSTSGNCADYLANMDILIDDKLVTTFYNVSKNFTSYTFTANTPIDPERIKISLANDCYNGAGNDTNLEIDKIYYEDKVLELYEHNKYIGRVTEFIQLPGKTARGTGWKYNGLKCFESGGRDCNDNLAYSRSIPLEGIDLSTSNNAVCSPSTFSSTKNNQSICNPSSLTSSNNFTGALTVNEASCSSGTDLTVKYTAQFYSNSYGSNLNIWSHAMDYLGANSGWNDLGNRTLDFTPPSLSASMTVLSKEKFNYTWSATDPTSGIFQTDLFPGLLRSFYPDLSKSVRDETSAVSVALPTSDDSYSTQAIFSSTNPGSSKIDEVGRTDVINIGTIEEGSVSIKLRATDMACNMKKETGGTSRDVGSPWFTTKGASVYSGGSISNPVVNFGSDNNLLPSGTLSWQYPFSISKNQTQISTNMILTSDASISQIIGRRNYYDPQSLRNYNLEVMDYDQLVSKLNSTFVSDVQNISYQHATMSTNISSICPDLSKLYCQILRNGDVTVNSNFVCDKGAIIHATGNIYLNPPITVGSLATNGCIFMADGNIDIKEGTYLSGGGVTQYDKIQAFLIAKQRINMGKVDASKTLADGVKIDGGLIAYGGNSNTPSINWKRSLQLLNNLENPSFAVSSDYRYYRLSTKFFGGNDFTYVKEIGYKPY